MKLSPGEHVVVIGTTRCGKSWFIRDHLLQCYPVYIIYDTKRQDPWTDWTGAYTCWTVTQVAQALLNGHYHIHYAARPLERDARITECNHLCELVLRTGGIALIIDEASHVMSSSFVPPGLEKLAVSGAGKKCTLVVATQRPKSIIHPIITTQSIHIIMGHISPREHTQDLARWLPLEHNPPFGSYRFVYIGPEGASKLIFKISM